MSARLIRRLRALRSRGRDAGISLTELIVAMGLTMLVGALTLGLFVGINTSSNATTDRTLDTASARNAVQSWTGYLRVADGKNPGIKAYRIEWLTDSDMLFYASLLNRNLTDIATTMPPTMIWLRKDSTGALVEEQFASTASAGTAPKVCRTLATNVSTPSAPLFTPYDSSGAEMAPQGTAPTPSAGCRALPLTPPSQLSTKQQNQTVVNNLQKVTSVAIDFVVRDSRGAHPLEFKSQAVLPALGSV